MRPRWTMPLYGTPIPIVGMTNLPKPNKVGSALDYKAMVAAVVALHERFGADQLDAGADRPRNEGSFVAQWHRPR
jgi:hypothetical protein